MLINAAFFHSSPIFPKGDPLIEGSGEECQRGQCCDSHSHVTKDITLNTNEACISLFPIWRTFKSIEHTVDMLSPKCANKTPSFFWV